ncbi:TetR/AcrR family transcriptional regulator [Insolitispirillum peregrinum]|uniref:Transcriptional regulator, TetR family n=1 Tax=Insolitispirillum peregrinum TaxID=80876 RepID=A0A1N7LLW4_9PROT|nr:TetR/AcrR family transcriptional regulator [Insolitispirillum peregrinum]SIS74820.1 transcriptional regulator, TetR family [Insolitispirillum peregrinum]
MIHDTPCRTQGRPRCEETTKAILAATRKLFERSNLRDMTIEAIAREAGVGKATIYRWWKTKNELVLDACFEDLQPRLDYGTTGSPACIIAEQVKRVVEAYRGPSGRMVAQLLAEAQYDPAVSRSFTEAYLSRRCCTLHTLLAQCGITCEAEQDAVAEQIYSPIFFRLIMGNAPLDEAFAKSVQTFVIQRLNAVQPARAPGC